MNYPAKILFQSFVKSFYRENAGTFIFFFTVMFFIVSQQSGAGLYSYHFSLVKGMLSNTSFLLFILLAWILYARKCTAFVSAIIVKPEYSFLHIFNYQDKAKRLKLFFIVEAWLLMPVILYALFIIIVGWQLHYYTSVLIVIFYLLFLCCSAAALHVYQLDKLHKNIVLPIKKIKLLSLLTSHYPVILIRFVMNKQKILWLGTKLFTCGVLYSLTKNNSLSDFDACFVFLFYNFGILANGIIIYRIREFEETYLMFYRGAPISLGKRLLQYSMVYFALLLPEFITVYLLAPAHLHYIDAINLTLCGYSLVLLMNSITFIQNFSMKQYLIMLLLIFCVQYLFLMTIGLTYLYLLFFIASTLFFISGYYKLRGRTLR